MSTLWSKCRQLCM